MHNAARHCQAASSAFPPPACPPTGGTQPRCQSLHYHPTPSISQIWRQTPYPGTLGSVKKAASLIRTTPLVRRSRRRHIDRGLSIPGNSGRWVARSGRSVVAMYLGSWILRLRCRWWMMCRCRLCLVSALVMESQLLQVLETLRARVQRSVCLGRRPIQRPSRRLETLVSLKRKLQTRQLQLRTFPRIPTKVSSQSLQRPTHYLQTRPRQISQLLSHQAMQKLRPRSR